MSPAPAPARVALPDGIVAIVKRDCPTCQLVEPVLRELAAGPELLTVVTQDDPEFPGGLDPLDDTDLALSFALDLDTVPTLLRVRGGTEVARTVGWSREQWEALTGRSGLGDGLPAHRPGCGSRTHDPDVLAAHEAAAGASRLRSRRITLGASEDEVEATYARGWSDGLPLVTPTPERVARMLTGTARDPDVVVAVVPPDLVECTVEKVAVNAVMAGCRPEYLPVVLAAVEGACTDTFNIHGVLATTWFAGPVLIVDGPIARSIGMNSGINALGQGNRANATIGRALQLVIRNVGGGRPGEIDRATLGQPGKYSFCFAENAPGAPWEPLHVTRGFAPEQSAVTLFAGESPRGIADQQSRTPESLAASMAMCLRAVAHPKIVRGFDAILVISPEHRRVFRDAGWSKARVLDELMARLQVPGAELVQGAGGVLAGLPESVAGLTLPKFRDGGLLIAQAGGGAGFFSAIIGGWASGPTGSEAVTVPIDGPSDGPAAGPAAD